MRAPASPPPRPDDWTNTGQHACISIRSTPRAAVSAEQFRRLPIPAPLITAQPDPSTRHTLINIPTNLYTSNDPVTLPTTVLGQRVRVRATPASSHWQYGDGEQLTTVFPGHPYPTMPTAHTYAQPGSYTVRLSTTFTGEYAIGSGPWQPIDGTATLPSPPVTITAEESRAVLVR